MTERAEVEKLPALKIVVRAIIVDENGRVMLGKRAGSTAKGLWALVGGKPDSGETLPQALAREVKEEVGLTIEEFGYFATFNNETNPDDPWRSVCFVVRARGELSLNGKEVSEVAFVSETDLDKYPIAPTHRKILEAFFKR